MLHKNTREQNIEIFISSYRLMNESLARIMAAANETAQAMESITSQVTQGMADFKNSIRQLEAEKASLLAERDTYADAGEEEKRLAVMDRLKKLNKQIEMKKEQGFTPPAELQIQFDKLRESLPTHAELNEINSVARQFQDTARLFVGQCFVFGEMVLGYRNKKLITA